MELKRAILEGCRQAKPIIDEIFLSGSISCIHTTDLRYGHMGFIDEEEIISWEKLEQCRRRISYVSITEIHRVVFDTIHRADL